jgi:chromosome segregation ATPase
MAREQIFSTEVDLERTDRLPIMEGTVVDHDVADDAVRLDYTVDMVGAPSIAMQYAPPDFARTSAVDLPSLAESVRSVEERIARQTAEYEALTRSYERARDAESATVARANALAADLAAARAQLESEQARAREIEKNLAEKSATTEAARARVEEAQRESERYQTESRTLRDSLATRDATIVQVLHSLGERDAQLAALQTEHAKIVPVLEATSKSNAQLEADLQAARSRSNAIAADLRASEETAASLSQQIRRAESDIGSTRAELSAVKSQATAYLEQLSSREYRSGFDLNLFRELDAQVGTAQVGQIVAQTERDQLQNKVAELEAKIAGQADAIDKLQSAAAANTATLAQQSNELKRAEAARAQLTSQLAKADGEVTRLNAELSTRERALAEARASSAGEAQRVTELLAEAERRQADQEAQIQKLLADHSAQFEKMSAEQTAQVQQMSAGHSAQIERMSADHSAQVRRMTSEHATQIDEISTELKAQLARIESESQAQITKLQAEAELRDQEMGVLVVHLQEARRPIQLIEADIKRLSDELAAKTAAHDEFAEENRKLRASLERTRGALEEREFLIRRLERSESNNANVLGRIQTSIERLGAAPTPVPPAGTGVSSAPASSLDWSPEFVRVDGDRSVNFSLVRRTRIGRAPGCELQVDSNSVSRHHALVLVGPRDVIIEDLNSTNGVVVNGRKVTRQLLTDGDLISIGEVQFRYAAKPANRSAEPRAVEPRAVEPRAAEARATEPTPIDSKANGSGATAAKTGGF